MHVAALKELFKHVRFDMRFFQFWKVNLANLH